MIMDSPTGISSTAGIYLDIYIYIDVLYFLLCVAAFQVVKLKYFLGEASL